MQSGQLPGGSQRQAYNWAGVGQVDGSVQASAAPELTDENTQRSERSLSGICATASSSTPSGASGWACAASQLGTPSSVRTDNGRPTRYEQSFATPWLGATWQFSPETMAYASWGQGVETDVAPNTPPAIPTRVSRCLR
ncbi:MAG: hypothetical protein U5L74_11020 [Ideonella sp.]|nr:hypothetical protein [Ideonella sp.]